MPYFSHNNSIQLVLSPDLASWDIYYRDNDIPLLQNVRMSLHYKAGNEDIWALEQWDDWHVDTSETTDTSFGPNSFIKIKIRNNHQPIVYELTFALPKEEPAIYWKLQVQNVSPRPINLEQIELLNIGFADHTRKSFRRAFHRPRTSALESNIGKIHLSTNPPSKKSTTNHDLAFFSNGWQSWSYTGVYSPNEHYQASPLGVFRRSMITNSSTPIPKRRGVFSSDMFGILGDRVSRHAILLGYLSQWYQFGSLQAYLSPNSPSLRMWSSGDNALVDPGDMVQTDWACIYLLNLDTPDPLRPYLEAVAREHGLDPSLTQPSPSGWCSWYFFSTKDYQGSVTPQGIRENLLTAESIKTEFPIKIIQIDDGFEQHVGDWFSMKPDFSDGMYPISDEIDKAGFIPGLWLSPFIIHPKSHIYHKHPEWILRTKTNRPVNAGFCWGAFNTALDLTHPDAMDYCKQVVHTAVHEWGYQYLKLDFLYAAALPGKYQNPHKTRAQVLREGLHSLREAAGPKTFLLGCGSPLGSAIGLVDAMRIGTDTARTWYPSFMGTNKYFDRDTSLPSAAFCLHNALTRAPMHNRWWVNDPDCLLVRPDSGLSIEEIQSVASVIALTGGALFISDDLSKLPEERLRIAKSLLPLINQQPMVLDWFDHSTPSLVQLDLRGAVGSWTLIGVFNWSDQAIPRTIHLSETQLNPSKKYLGRDFWNGQCYFINQGELVIPNLPAHGVCLLALREQRSKLPLYLGSDLHISQGLEITQWSVKETELLMRLERPGQTTGLIELYLPDHPSQVICDDQSFSWRDLGSHRYQFHCQFNHTTQLHLKF